MPCEKYSNIKAIAASQTAAATTHCGHAARSHDSPAHRLSTQSTCMSGSADCVVADLECEDEDAVLFLIGHVHSAAFETCHRERSR